MPKVSDLIDDDLTDLQNVALALHRVAMAIQELGMGRDGQRSPGAFEGHTMMLRDKIAPMLADAIEQGFQRLAEAVEDTAKGK